MGRRPTDHSLNNFPGPSWYSVVAPFAYDIDTSSTGSVRYTAFKYDLQTSTVSTFIRSQTGNSFYGTRMMVAEWRRVSQQYGFSVSLTSPFKHSNTCTFLYMYKTWLYRSSADEVKIYMLWLI